MSGWWMKDGISDKDVFVMPEGEYDWL